MIDGRPVTSASSVGPAAHRPRPHDRPQRRRQVDVQRHEHPDVRRTGRTPQPAGRGARQVLRRAVGGRSGETPVGRIATGHHANDAIPTTLARERARQPDRRRPARRHRRRRPRRRRRRADEPGRRARRPPFAQQRRPRRQTAIVTYEEAFTVQPFNNLVTTQTFTGAQFLDVLKDQWCGSTAARTCCCRRARSATRRTSRSPTSILGQPCAGAAEPGQRRDDRRRGARPGRDVPDHDEQLPRRRRGQLPVADGGDEPHDAAGGRFDIDSLVDYLEPTLSGRPDRARRRWTAIRHHARREHSERCGGGPCAAAARSGTIAARDSRSTAASSSATWSA